MVMASGMGEIWRGGMLLAVFGLGMTAPFVVAALAMNLIPFNPGGSTESLAAIHLPMALWLTVGAAYAAGAWRDHDQRMNYVRFSGEWFIYYTLIALGGGVRVGRGVGVGNGVDEAQVDRVLLLLPDLVARVREADMSARRDELGFRMRVTEPEPGRVLAETDLETGLVLFSARRDRQQATRALRKCAGRRR